MEPAYEDEKIIKIAVQSLHHIPIVLVCDLVVDCPVVGFLAERLGDAVLDLKALVRAGTAAAETPTRRRGEEGRHDWTRSKP